MYGCQFTKTYIIGRRLWPTVKYSQGNRSSAYMDRSTMTCHACDCDFNLDLWLLYPETLQNLNFRHGILRYVDGFCGFGECFTKGKFITSKRIWRLGRIAFNGFGCFVGRWGSSANCWLSSLGAELSHLQKLRLCVVFGNGRRKFLIQWGMGASWSWGKLHSPESETHGFLFRWRGLLSAPKIPRLAWMCFVPYALCIVHFLQEENLELELWASSQVDAVEKVRVEEEQRLQIAKSSKEKFRSKVAIADVKTEVVDYLFPAKRVRKSTCKKDL